MTNLSNLQVGSFETSPKNSLDSYHKFVVPFAATPGKKVVVIPAIQTRNGNNIPNLRIWNVSNEGFNHHFDELNANEVKMETEEGEVVRYKRVISGDLQRGKPAHRSETIAYIAFEIDTIAQ